MGDIKSFDPTSISSYTVSWVNSSGSSLPIQAWEMTANGHVSEAFVFCCSERGRTCLYLHVSLPRPKKFCCRSASSSFRILVSDCFFSPMRSCSPGAELYRKLCGRPLIFFSNISKVVTKANLMTLVAGSSRNLLGIPHFFPAYSLKRNFPS